ncbi:MAG: PAS domain-containing protein, partial [Sulfurimonas sp.]|nr:PAS domain-containing protein [Sulfurimonas sp.]
MDLSQQLFDSEIILDSLWQNIFVKDVNSVYLFSNNTYANLIGKKPSEIIGKNDFDFFPKEIAEKYRQDDAAIFKNKESIDVEEEILVGNQKRIIRTIKKPLYDNNKVIALVGIFWDITKEKEEELKYKKLQFGLNQAQKLAHIGHWELDLQNNQLYWSDEVYRIFGLKPQEFGATYEA